MWIVRLALRRPYTFIVMAILIGIHGRTFDRHNTHRHFSLHQYSNGGRDLELQRHESG